jgi:hypothetical protein
VSENSEPTTVKHSNYVNNIPDDNLVMPKHVADETAIMYDSAAHHQSTYTTGSYTSETAHTN